MISSSFNILTKDILKLQTAAKVANARFKDIHIYGDSANISIDFENEKIYKLFNETWADLTKVIKEVDKRPNFLQKLYRRYLTF